MTSDPAEGAPISDVARKLRAGAVTSEALTAAYLERIAALGTVDAYYHLDAQAALATARGMDVLLAGGTDLGPLMGLPIAVKDHIVVERMPTTAGTRMPLDGLIPPEGPIVRALKRAGCVVLGKTRATEFALGTYNLSLPRPRNPWDMHEPRMTGGSSSGSAAAMAARLCTFALGTDTGGSVREPAALCGVVGYKPTYGRWPADGVFPLSTSFDSVGTLTASVVDAAWVFATLDGAPLALDLKPAGLRFGMPRTFGFEDLDADVARAMAAALDALQRAGVTVEEVDIPPLPEMNGIFGRLLPAELIAYLGPQRFAQYEHVLDPVVRSRAAAGAEVTAVEYISSLEASRKSAAAARVALRGYDAWMIPTSPSTAARMSEVTTTEAATAWNLRTLRNTRATNIFGQCAISLPIPNGGPLPVGLQLSCNPGEDARLLAIALAVERVLGTQSAPPL